MNAALFLQMFSVSCFCLAEKKKKEVEEEGRGGGGVSQYAKMCDW